MTSVHLRHYLSSIDERRSYAIVEKCSDDPVRWFLNKGSTWELWTVSCDQILGPRPLRTWGEEKTVGGGVVFSLEDKSGSIGRVEDRWSIKTGDAQFSLLEHALEFCKGVESLQKLRAIYPDLKID